MTHKLKDVYAFLDIVRSTGKINMLASAPFIMNEFDVSRREARELLRSWTTKDEDRLKVLNDD